MTNVYLTTAGSIARVRAGRLEVLKDGQALDQFPIEQVERVVVVGRGVQLTTALLMELLRREVPVAFVSRSGRLVGSAHSGVVSRGATLRRAQYAALGAPEPALTFAASVVRQKLAGQRRHLQTLSGAGPADVAARLLRLEGQATGARTLDELRGYEGAAAAMYWQAIVSMVPPTWRFTGRRHHPAPDPFNALLSFGYTLLLQEIITAVALVGLDPGVGALHPADGSRPSLALDLEEPFRPLGIDEWVLRAVRRGELRLNEFHQDGERVLLTPAGRRAFLAAYEQAMRRRVRHPLAPGRVPVRQALELHVRLTARLFMGEAEEVGAVEWPGGAPF
jgi:CRISPR-associated protein Cas1